MSSKDACESHASAAPQKRRHPPLSKDVKILKKINQHQINEVILAIKEQFPDLIYSIRSKVSASRDEQTEEPLKDEVIFFNKCASNLTLSFDQSGYSLAPALTQIISEEIDKLKL